MLGEIVSAVDNCYEQLNNKFQGISRQSDSTDSIIKFRFSEDLYVLFLVVTDSIWNFRTLNRNMIHAHVCETWRSIRLGVFVDRLGVLDNFFKDARSGRKRCVAWWTLLKKEFPVWCRSASLCIFTPFTFLFTKQFKRSSDAIKPVVVGLLAGLAFKHFLALASNIGISCFMATLYSILPRKKTSLALVQGAPFSNSGAVWPQWTVYFCAEQLSHEAFPKSIMLPCFSLVWI